MRSILILLSSFSFSFSFCLSAEGTVVTDRNVDQVQKIIILGDSLTEGYGIEKSQAFPAKLEQLLNKKTGKYSVLAAGTSGSTSASGYKRLKWHLRAKPQVLILALGGNDALRGVKPLTTKKNLAKVIRLAKKNGLKVFLAGMKTPTNYGNSFGKDFEKIFKELALEYQIGLIPFLLQDVGGVAKYNLQDGIHPNETGHSIIAKNLFNQLKDKL